MGLGQIPGERRNEVEPGQIWSHLQRWFGCDQVDRKLNKQEMCQIYKKEQLRRLRKMECSIVSKAGDGSSRARRDTLSSPRAGRGSLTILRMAVSVL